MADITVSLRGGEFLVVVDDGRGRSEHRVTAAPDVVADLGGGASAVDLIGQSFEFLLEREPKESILARFDLPVIGRYFPEYPEEIRRRLAGR